jgi:hypothetical protein
VRRQSSVVVSSFLDGYWSISVLFLFLNKQHYDSYGLAVELSEIVSVKEIREKEAEKECVLIKKRYKRWWLVQQVISSFLDDSGVILISLDGHYLMNQVFPFGR